MFETEVAYKGFCDQCKTRHRFITRFLIDPDGIKSVCKECDAELGDEETIEVTRCNWDDASLDGEE